MTIWIVFAQLFATIAMVGLIWFVQVVHYPLFAKVGTEMFSEYETRHQQLTSLVVMPLMLTEVFAALFLVFVPPNGTSITMHISGVALLALIWASTFLLQVPAHAKLAKGFDERSCRRLVSTNWIRTIAWSGRSVIVTAVAYDAIVAQAMS